jgi:hypothetical protein
LFLLGGRRLMIGVWQQTHSKVQYKLFTCRLYNIVGLWFHDVTILIIYSYKRSTLESFLFLQRNNHSYNNSVSFFSRKYEQFNKSCNSYIRFCSIFNGIHTMYKEAQNV